MFKLFSYRIFFAVMTIAMSSFVFASQETATDENGVILAGHDAVAYFTEGKPVLGSAEFTAIHKGAIYRFSSAENRDLFKHEPKRFEPAYGGYCALGATMGETFKVDGKAFEIVDGKLYVNRDKEVYDVWKMNIPQNLLAADAEWPEIQFVAVNNL